MEQQTMATLNIVIDRLNDDKTFKFELVDFLSQTDHIQKWQLEEILEIDLEFYEVKEVKKELLKVLMSTIEMS